MKLGRYLYEGELAFWVFNDLSDPLCGTKANIEQYLNVRHKHPGLAVELGAQSIAIQTIDGQTLINYRFNRNSQIELIATVDTTRLRRHRRGYVGFGGAKIMNVRWKISTERAKPNPVGVVVDLGLETKLDHNVAAVLAIKQELAARLSQVV